jgi:RNA polymerase sigma-70 factor (ECF subfamily)
MAGTEVAAEVTQEVFMRLWQHPDRFDQARGPLRAFLLMSTRAICIDLMRSRAAQRIREQRDARRTRPHDSQTDDALLADETAARITAALLRLSDEDRDAIVRAYYGRMSYRAVAIDTGVAEGTIKSRIRHGLAQLRQILADIAPSPTIPIRAGDP